MKNEHFIVDLQEESEQQKHERVNAHILLFVDNP